MQEKRRSSLPSKLIPKDISESLGKLPPQSPEMEEAVLGAILLEKTALLKVIGFLKPDHFYMDTHKEIYDAALAMHAEGVPIDMRTISSKLAKIGKLEIVGGRYYIAELTNKVSSSANIETHAREVVEKSIKRSLIQMASKIHQMAYEDTTDPFDLLEKTTADLQFFKDNTTLENSEDKVKQLWAKRLITTEPPAEIPLICLSGEPVATSGNHSLITGKKKARKTLFITWLIHQYFLQTPKATADDIILFDTEQGKTHVWKVKNRIKILTGFDLPILFMRGMSPLDRRNLIENTVKYWKKKPKIIVIDGIRDLLSNINDVDESTDVIVWMEKMIIDYNIHVMNILHQNKNDKNPRGHVGTELSNKAEITMELEKDEKAGCTIVRSESSREKDFEPFSFTHSKDGLPEVIGMPIRGEIIPEDTRRTLLFAAFEDGPMVYKELLEEVTAQFAVGQTKAKALIREFKRMGWLTKSGRDRDPKALWKLMITSDGVQNLIPIADAIKQAELFENGHATVPTIEEDYPPEDLPF